MCNGSSASVAGVVLVLVFNPRIIKIAYIIIIPDPIMQKVRKLEFVKQKKYKVALRNQTNKALNPNETTSRVLK